MAEDDFRAKVLFPLSDGPGAVDAETLWARQLGNDKFQIDNCPFYAYDVSLDDIVLAPFDKLKNLPTFQTVLSKSGNRTIRILFEPSAQTGLSESILKTLVALGCSYEGANSRYFAVNVPPGSDIVAVTKYITETGIAWEIGDAKSEREKTMMVVKL